MYQTARIHWREPVLFVYAFGYRLRKQPLHIGGPKSTRCKAVVSSHFHGKVKTRCFTNNARPSFSTRYDRFACISFTSFLVSPVLFQFVSHPFSQLLLNSDIYEGVPCLKRKSYWTIFGLTLLMFVIFPLLLPVFTAFHVFCPQNKISRMVSSPLVKYLAHLSSYCIFLVLLICSSFQPAKNFLEFGEVGE